MTSSHLAESPPQHAYLRASLAGDRCAAWNTTRDAIAAGWPLEAIYRDLLRWSQRRVGELWARAEITVADEHLASAVTQSIAARMYPQITVARTAGRALVAGVEGELHTLPAQLAADLLELSGWDVVFLGTHVPEDALLAAIDTHRPDVVGLSATMTGSLTRTSAVVTAVRRRSPELPIIVGGRALQLAPTLAEDLGVELDLDGELTAFSRHAMKLHPLPNVDKRST